MEQWGKGLYGLPLCFQCHGILHTQYILVERMGIQCGLNTCTLKKEGAKYHIHYHKLLNDLSIEQGSRRY